MDGVQCRRRAALCREEAERSWGFLRDDLLWAAENWERLAAELDRLARIHPGRAVAAFEEHA